MKAQLDVKHAVFLLLFTLLFGAGELFKLIKLYKV